MKRFMEFYNPNKEYYFQNYQKADHETLIKEYPILINENIDCVIETDVDGIFFAGFYPLSILKGLYYEKIDFTEMTKDEILDAICNYQEPAPLPTSEERIAAQLELQNLLSMPDIA